MPLTILTCNIRYLGAPDGDNAWAFRKDLAAEVIRSREPDIICFQELWVEQFADLSAALPGFVHYGITDLPTERRRLNCIFYRTEAFETVCAGGYWLSETPHVPGSTAWDSACVRTVNWVRLIECATGVECRAVNTHLDHVSQLARDNQARTIVEDARAYPDDYPQLLAGDMNADQTNPAIHTLKAGGWVDTYEAVHGTGNPGHTHHAFEGPDYDAPIGKMDWIFTRGTARATDTEIIRDHRDGRYPSDHYFVGANIVLAPDAG